VPEIPWDIISNIGWVVTLASIIGLGYKIGRWSQKIEDRLKEIEKNPIITASSNISTKVVSDLLYDVYEKKIKHNPLTPDEIRLRRELTEKIDAGTITPDEAKILRDILNKELEEARAAGNIIAVLAILFLLGLVIAVLSD
jgi:hypothetical protein